MNDNDIIIHEAQQYITRLFNGIYDGHDVNHSKRVYNNALHIAKSIPKCDTFILSLSALLHDVDDYKLFHTNNNENARMFLEMHNVSSIYIEEICKNINSVSYSQNRGISPSSIEGKVVQDADRLDAMGAIGIARTFAYSGSHGRSLSGTIEHFSEKLLLLINEMNTEPAKQIAELRHNFMLKYLYEIKKETYGFI